MPTYNYICLACDKKIISGGSGLIFKGSGFYLTDYKNNNKTNKSKE